MVCVCWLTLGKASLFLSTGHLPGRIMFFFKGILLYPSVCNKEYAGIVQKWKKVTGINVRLWEFKHLDLRGSGDQGEFS